MLTRVADRLLDCLSDPSADFVVVVEGKKDVEALRRLGVLHVEMLNRYEDVYEMADDLSERGIRRAVVLTDYDRTGEALAEKITLAFMSAGIKVDQKTRKMIRNVFHVRFVENLDRIVEEMERGDHVG